MQVLIDSITHLNKHFVLKNKKYVFNQIEELRSLIRKTENRNAVTHSRKMICYIDELLYKK